MKQAADNVSQVFQKNLGIQTQDVQAGEPENPTSVSVVDSSLNRTFSDNALQSQATLLGNDQFQPAQQHALVNQIGRTHSNRHLQRVLAVAQQHVQRQQQPTRAANPQQAQQRIARLTDRITRALVQAETPRGVSESDMRTSAGVKASYASRFQATAEWSIDALKNTDPQVRQREFNLTRQEVLSAEERVIKVRELWVAVHRVPANTTVATFLSNAEHRALLSQSGLNQNDLHRMLRFRTLRLEMQADLNQAVQALKPPRSAAKLLEARRSVASRFERSPIAIELGLNASSLTGYLGNNWSEDRAGWQRLALERIPAAQPRQPTIGARVRAAATANEGWKLGRYEIERRIRNYIRSHARASDEQVCLEMARQHNSRAGQEYRNRVLGHFRRLP